MDKFLTTINENQKLFLIEIKFLFMLLSKYDTYHKFFKFN